MQKSYCLFFYVNYTPDFLNNIQFSSKVIASTEQMIDRRVDVIEFDGFVKTKDVGYDPNVCFPYGQIFYSQDSLLTFLNKGLPFHQILADQVSSK